MEGADCWLRGVECGRWAIEVVAARLRCVGSRLVWVAVWAEIGSVGVGRCGCVGQGRAFPEIGRVEVLGSAGSEGVAAAAR